MAKNNESEPFDGFEVVYNELMPGAAAGKPEELDDDFSNIPVKDNKNEEENKPSEEDEGGTKKPSGDDDTDDGDTGTSEEDEEDKSGTSEEGSEEGESSEGDEDEGESGGETDPEFEETVSTYLKERIEEELGLEFPEEAEIKTVGDVIDYIDAVVEEASRPTYANEELAKLDQYVKAGGRLEDYIKQTYGDASVIDLDNVDLEDELVQENLVRERLKLMGYDDEKIKKTLNRYKTAEVLFEEAEDAKDVLKKFRENRERALLEEQKRMQEASEQQKQAFIESVQKTISDLKEIDGVPLTKKDKLETLRYIFEVGDDGLTAFQRDSQEDPVNTLIKTAFVVKNKSFTNTVKKRAESEAYKKLRSRIKTSSKRKNYSSGGGGNDDDKELLAELSKYIK